MQIEISNYLNIPIISCSYNINALSMTMDGLILATSSNVLTFESDTLIKQSNKLPPNMAIMKNVPTSKVPKNHLSNRWSIRRFPPPMIRIKLSMSANWNSSRARHNCRRNNHRMIAVATTNNTINPATNWTAPEALKIFLSRWKFVPYTNIAMNFIEWNG